MNNNPFEGIDFDETAKLPTIDDDQPSFPDFPEELGNVQNEQSLNLDFDFNTPKESNDVLEPLFPDVPDEFGDENINTPVIDDSPTKVVSNNGGGNDIPPVNPPKNKNGKKKPKKGQFKKDPTVLNIVVTIFTIVANVLVTLVLFNTTRFSAVGKNIFLIINLVALVLLVLLDILVILMIRTKKVVMFVISCVVLSLFVGVGGYGIYALGRVNTNVNKITGDTKEEEVSASLVIYSGTSGDPITDVKDLEGRRIGISSGSTTAEIAKTKLSNEGINVEYVEVNGYTELLTQLISGGVDCAVMPVSYASQFEEDENLSAYLPDTQSILDFSDTVTTASESGADKDITKEPFTVLVTGENEGLADSIILMSVNPISMKVTMTSIARDSYVPISCYGSSDKINAAHAASESCMVQTVENLMGIDIDYTIEFNFASVIQVVDAIGGINITNETEFIGQSWNIEKDELEVALVPAGNDMYVNGAQALAFVRERMAFADGDFARQRHQQQVIECIIEKLMASKSPQMFLDVLDAAGNNIKTNFSVEQMTGFINFALQKAKRYYNSDSVSGLFNFESSRVYGYAADLWNNSLQMDLWIYRLFNGSIEDCAAAIRRNLSTTDTPSTPTSVSWSAANTYTPDPVSQEEYNETRITDDGRPDPTPTPEESASAEPTETPTSTPTDSPSVVPDNSGSTDTSGGTDSSTDTSGGGEVTPVAPETPSEQTPAEDSSGTAESPASEVE